MHETISAVAAVARTFAVLLSKRDSVEAGLVALAKRAARKGLPALTWSWGKAYASTVVAQFPFCWSSTGNHYPSVPEEGRIVEICDGFCLAEVPAARVDLTLPVELPKYAGWAFVAALQHLDGENIVRTLPGAECPPEYRTRGPACDHCKADRRRNDTYILRHEDGRTIQVGSTCIDDFLGADDAGRLAASASYLALAAGLAEEGCGGFGGSTDRLISEFLPFVAWTVREHGWTSRTRAREVGGQASADFAWRVTTDSKARREAKAEPSTEDAALALAAEQWAESLTDAQIAADRGDYLHNLRAACRTGSVTSRTAGIIGSVVVAYQRAIGQERQRAARAARPTLDAYVGTVGAKVTFGLAPKVGKRGQPLKGAPIALDANPVTLDFVTGYETAYGYTTILKFRTAEGATLVWKASGDPGVGREDVGKTYTLAGTIKAHDTYKDQKQTVMTRCDIRPVAEVTSDVASDLASDAAQ